MNNLLVIKDTTICRADLRRKIFQHVQKHQKPRVHLCNVDVTGKIEKLNDKLSVHWLNIPAPKYIPDLLWKFIMPKILVFEGFLLEEIDVRYSSFNTRSILIHGLDGEFISQT